MKIKIRVDRNLCIGSAACIALAADVFRLDSEQKAVVLDQNDKTKEATEAVWEVVDQAEVDRLITAAKSCPTLAIIVTDDSGKQLYP